MQQFAVPQFVDVESKIFGPLGVRQFLISIAGFLFILLEYKLLAFPYAIGSGVFTAIIFASFAFLKINNAPLHMFLVHILATSRRPKVRVWNKADTILLAKEKAGRASDLQVASDRLYGVAPSLVQKQPLQSSKLVELSLILDTGGKFKGQ